MRYLILSVFMVGCGSEVGDVAVAHTAEKLYPTNRSVSLSVGGQPDFVRRAAEVAADVWRAHGLIFTVSDTGDLPILDKQPPVGALGVYQGDSGEIWIEDMGDEPGSACTLVHELGHSVGMEHVSNVGSLMSKIAGVNENGSCLWTDLDNAELIRVKGS